MPPPGPTRTPTSTRTARPRSSKPSSSPASKPPTSTRDKARLSSEHALIDDNADGKGTPADWFEGTRLARKPKDGTADGLKANQFHLIRNERDRQAPPEVLRRRDELELQVAGLRDRNAGLDEADYYRQLEALMLPLARTYAPIADGHGH